MIALANRGGQGLCAQRQLSLHAAAKKPPAHTCRRFLLLVLRSKDIQLGHRQFLIGSELGQLLGTAILQRPLFHLVQKQDSF